MATPVIDIEAYMDMIEYVMTNNTALNSKITAIENEKIAAGKALTPTLATVEADAYFPQTWSSKILNRNPAIFYGVENVAVLDEVPGAVLKNISFFIEVCIVDSGQTNDIWRRISRYARALEELFLENFGAALGSGNVKIEALRPTAHLLSLQSNDELKVGGINITIPLG